MVDFTLYKKEWTKRQIKALRKKYRISRHVLGQLLGVTENCVYMWETGERYPSWTANILLSYVERDLGRFK